MSRRRANNEGTVFQDKNGVWWAQLPPDHQGKRPKRRAATQREALEKLRELQRSRDNGLNLTNKQPTTSDFLDIWLEEVVKPTVKEKTLENYEQVTRLYIKPHIGNLRLDRLTTPQVQAMINDLLEQVSERTVHNAYARLHAALDTAVEWGYIARNIAAGVRLPRVSHAEQAVLSFEQAQRLLGAVEGHRLAVLYHVALTLGLRKGETLGLSWRDLDWDKEEIQITQQVQTLRGKTTISSPKTESSRRVLPVPPALLEQLRAHWQEQQAERRLLGVEWREHGLIFASECGTPIQPRNLLRHFKAALDAAGLPSVRFHDLRHTCATCLGEIGVPEALIASILGHSGGSITRRYVHTSLAAMRDALGRLEQMLLRRAA